MRGKREKVSISQYLERCFISVEKRVMTVKSLYPLVRIPCQSRLIFPEGTGTTNAIIK